MTLITNRRELATGEWLIETIKNIELGSYVDFKGGFHRRQVGDIFNPGDEHGTYIVLVSPADIDQDEDCEVTHLRVNSAADKPTVELGRKPLNEPFTSIGYVRNIEDNGILHDNYKQFVLTWELSTPLADLIT